MSKEIIPQDAPFEALMEELESIVQKLEGGNSPLEEMVALYERGAALGKRCMELLDSYEGRLTTINRPEDQE
ncbi:MAG TPA: exodeoxyribonuclease VII small subunit [Feifaniaceae bacterium]|nr:exodeoxyribonuclease VII small subunit [Feifaniaceae bacterium]